MSKHPQRRPRPMGIATSKYRRIKHEITVFRKTEEVSDWLAKQIARYDWVRYEAFPALKPPDTPWWEGAGIGFTVGVTDWHGTFGSNQ